MRIKDKLLECSLVIATHFTVFDDYRVQTSKLYHFPNLSSIIVFGVYTGPPMDIGDRGNLTAEQCKGRDILDQGARASVSLSVGAKHGVP